MNYKFIQPVSMRVTKEQYERDLREPLLAMGYREIILDWILNPILASNLDGRNDILSNVSGRKSCNNRYFIDHYNPKLFLAIAAMTDKESPIVGEWLVWNSVYASVGGYKIGDIVQCGNPNITLVGLRKATLKELIDKFSPNGEEYSIISNTNDKINKNMIQINNKQFGELKNLIAPENEEAFNKIMGIKKPIFNKENFITGDKVIVRNGCIYLVIENCNAGYYGKQVFTLLRCNMNGGFLSGHFYDNELRNLNSSDFDIMKVYRFEDGRIVDSSMNGDLEDYDLVWSRE